ncbi:DUF2634 domain-containing protein [Vallitalea okinawensis]|uniref:DUF2634 domain-containing protein n=1 Tax=Vallitalea okinawensis TaxID=2078660 RepID=UPI000CFDFB3C|nr:DUF2634 domain-containing protein [Vallitalea okinawensis]
MIPSQGLQTLPTQEDNNQTFRTYLYDFNNGDFILRDGKLVQVEGIDALKIWIDKIIRTPKNKVAIYLDTDYGVAISDLIVGNNYPLDFIEAEVKRELSSALLQHPDIHTINQFKVIREDDEVSIEFKVNHRYEVNYSV